MAKTPEEKAAEAAAKAEAKAAAEAAKAEEKAAAEEAARLAAAANETPKSGRKAAWEAFLEKAEKQNPEKFATKKARGEFDTIPDGFAG